MLTISARRSNGFPKSTSLRCCALLWNVPDFRFLRSRKLPIHQDTSQCSGAHEHPVHNRRKADK
jgi:hypothetical protein